MDSFNPLELRQRLDAGEVFTLLDVREADELAICALDGVVHIPLGELSVRHTELDPDAPTVVICHHGMRSAHAVMGLEGLGFEKLYNLTGGMDRWALEVDPALARY